MVAKHLAIAAVAVVAVACHPAFGQETPAENQPTLMGMLSEWRYPDSAFHGAQSTDAAVSGISAIESKALLSTHDSPDAVMEYYRKKLKVGADGETLGGNEGERITSDRSVLIHDLSASRPLKLYMIAVNEKKSSTTLVVSRVEGEAETSIAWSNYRQLLP